MDVSPFGMVSDKPKAEKTNKVGKVDKVRVPRGRAKGTREWTESEM